MRIFYVFILIAGIIGVFGSSGCNLINPAETVPTYVHIDSFSFTADAAKGSASHKITNAYVYFNNSPVGIFDLPVTFPVITTQPGTLTILPGIDFDGLTGYEVVYPLYNGYSTPLTPAAGGTVNCTPATRYNDAAMLRISESFEQGTGSGNTFVRRSGDTSIVNTATDVFEGRGSGLISLAGSRDSATVLSATGYVAPGADAYIELDYKGTATLTVGVRALSVNTTGDTYDEYIRAFKPRADWGKIYIGIREFISAHQALEYKIILGAQKVPGATEGEMRVDNVKLISF